VADGATTISDVAVLADQAALFGPVASDSTYWRLLDRLDTAQLRAPARSCGPSAPSCRAIRSRPLEQPVVSCPGW
jgi:hypothetical protein